MNRREVLKKSLMGAGAALSIPLISKAEQCLNLRTPLQPEGPFYPVKKSESDTDLTYVRSREEQAEGEVIIVKGVVTNQDCIPVKGALVEIWQACASGRYDHPAETNTAPLDPNFQYWGKAVTDDKGNYQFKTIKPGAYPAGDGWIRPPHIHFKVSSKGSFDLITQMYFSDEEVLNQADLILQKLSQKNQNAVIVNLEKEDPSGLPQGVFNIQIESLF